jgi:hypothetical protein
MWLEQKPIANVDVSDIPPSRLGQKWGLPVKR